MPSLKDIRKRITSVTNTQKLTRAMKLVAAAKLRKAQQAIVAARPYADAIEDVVYDLAGRAGADAHPLMEQREGKKAEILLLTSDRGLAGGFNSQLIRRVEAFVEEDLSDYSDVSLRIVGRKGNDYFKRRSANIRDYTAAPTNKDALTGARELANHVVADFIGHDVDRVFLVYNEFKSAMTQEVVVKQLLPINAGGVEEASGSSEEFERSTAIATRDKAPAADGAGGDFVYEPSKEALLEHLIPQYVQVSIFRASLESIASEQGSRMSAMDSATRNAGEMIDKLKLQFNRARQAAITKELLEIISGAESLKG